MKKKRAKAKKKSGLFSLRYLLPAGFFLALSVFLLLGLNRNPNEIPSPLIGKAAGGSMRDGLSLLDQAIALGAGQVKQATVQEMLGTVDEDDFAAVTAGGEGENSVGLHN